MAAKRRQKKGEQVGRRVVVADRTTDVYGRNIWTYLPDPDPVLRKHGGGRQDTFDLVETDAHVLGEQREIRSALLTYEHRVIPGGESPRARKAAELARLLMARPPAPDKTWGDVLWTITSAVFRGYAVHDLIWGMENGYTMPLEIHDRPQRRFVFNAKDNELRVRNFAHAGDWNQGIPIPPMQVLLTRHMPTYENPYGRAALSACIWPFLFKHAGWRFFTNFCEKFGTPLTIAKFPVGYTEPQINALTLQLNALVDAGVAAVEMGVEIEALAAPNAGSGGGAGMAPERLITRADEQMSKALTSQTGASQLPANGGSRAAVETHREREKGVNASDRKMVAETMTTLFGWITLVNFGPGVPGPRFVFHEDSPAPTEWAGVIETAQRVGLPVVESDALSLLGLAEAKPGDKLLTAPAPAPGAGGPPGSGTASLSACPGCGEGLNPITTTFEAAVRAVLEVDASPGDLRAVSEPLVRPVLDLARDNPEKLQAELATIYPELKADALQSRVERILFVTALWGRIKAAQGEDSNAATG